jgi:hypothetical protein
MQSIGDGRCQLWSSTHVRDDQRSLRSGFEPAGSGVDAQLARRSRACCESEARFGGVDDDPLARVADEIERLIGECDVADDWMVEALGAGTVQSERGGGIDRRRHRTAQVRWSPAPSSISCRLVSARDPTIHLLGGAMVPSGPSHVTSSPGRPESRGILESHPSQQRSSGRASAVDQEHRAPSTWSSEINRSVDVEGRPRPDTGQEPAKNLHRKEPT